MIVAFVITAHGYGHAARQMEVMRALLSRSPELRVVVLTAAPVSIFRDYLAAAPQLFARVTIVPFRADVGLVQKDGLVFDRDATLVALERAYASPSHAEDALAEALAVHTPSVVVGDIPPVAFAAAARLGVPSVAVGNFDWAFIYGSYAKEDLRFAPWAELAERWQARATLAIQLEPGPRLTAFREVVAGGVVARRRLAPMSSLRERLDVPPRDRIVLASFGGFGLSDPERWMPRIDGVTWLVAAPMTDPKRDDARFVAEEAGIPYLELLAGADAVLTKPGYGIVAEAATHRTRVLYTDRGDFPEAPYLIAWLHRCVPAAHVGSSDATPSVIGRRLAELWAEPASWPGEAEAAGGGELIARRIEAVIARPPGVG